MKRLVNAMLSRKQKILTLQLFLAVQEVRRTREASNLLRAQAAETRLVANELIARLRMLTSEIRFSGAKLRY